MANIVTAINALTGPYFTISATAHTPANHTCTLANSATGVAGNVTITTTETGLTVSGMSGGTAGSITTITASAATFYPSMVGRTITVTGTGALTIAGYTSATVVTVAGDHSWSSTATFSIVSAGRFRLPATFSGTIEKITYVADGLDMPQVQHVSTNEIDLFYQTGYSSLTGWPLYLPAAVPPNITGQPWAWNIEPEQLSTDKQTYNLYLYPLPTEVRTMIYRPRLTLGPVTNSASVYLPGGDDHINTYIQLALAAAELDRSGNEGSQEIAAQDLLMDSIRVDRTLFGKPPQTSMVPNIHW
jgi:hypothetical protein